MSSTATRRPRRNANSAAPRTSPLPAARHLVASFVVGLGAGSASPVAAATATAVCAAALAPLRGRLQRRVDRRLYPTRRAAIAAIEELQRRTHAGAARPEQLEAALRTALRDSALQVGYRLPGQSDGAGLVDAMAIRLAQLHLDDPAIDVNSLLDHSVAELATAVAELRQIAHGLLPSSLDDGLCPALTTLANSAPVPVTLDVHPGSLPDDVAITAYYVASEAMANGTVIEAVLPCGS